MRVGTGRVLGWVGMPVLVVCCCVSSVALALPSGRVYEQVSPEYKAGYGVGLTAVAPDGESVAFSSHGVFAGEPYFSETSGEYLARRGPTGWSTTALSPPPVFGSQDFSSTLEYALGGGSLETAKEGTPSVASEYLLHRTDTPDTAENWEVAGGVLLKLLNGEPLQKGLTLGVSADLCHIVFGLAEGPLLPEAEGTSDTQLYDLASAPAGGCHGDGSQSLRLVSVKNTPGPHGEPEPIDGHCISEPGMGTGYGGIGSQQAQESSFNPLADGGEEIFFTSGLGKDCGKVHQLFVRLGGERTLEVSKPVSQAQACGEEVPCPGATTRASSNFSGASEDGSRVFFTTTAQLTEEDKDEAKDLYMASIGCPQSEPGCPVAKREVTSLVQASHDPTGGQAAEVQGVVRIAQDGSRVYFVARGDLLSQAEREALEGEGRAVPHVGADNLYVYGAETGTVFVADLCSGPLFSGLVEDRSCPADLDEASRNDTGLWGNGQEAQSNSDGRFLVFSTYAQLVKGDTNNAKDVYRYDAVTGALDRVSHGEAGYEANGNRNDEEIEVNEKKEIGHEADAGIPLEGGGIKPGSHVFQEYAMASRAISEDGSRIVFSTVEPLSPDATNGLVNVYEWHMQAGEAGEGQVSLVSSGTAPTTDGFQMITPSGQDIFFTTTAQLVPQDTDELTDIYDARLAHVPGEQLSFSLTGSERQQCLGEACHGPLTNPVPLLVPGSVPQAPGGNFAAPSTTATTPKKTTPKCSKGKKLSHGKCVKTKAKSKKKTKAKKANKAGHGRGR
jgi:hypothetical protein